MRGDTPAFDLSPERVTSGRLNDWQDRIIITVDMTYPAEMVEGIRSIRDRVHEGVLSVFEHYRGSTETDFDRWLRCVTWLI
jgi:hypothetical protein